MSTELVAATSTAIERLVQSRARLREAMLGKTGTAGVASGRKAVPDWLRKLKSVPLVAVVTEALGSWWMQHPLRAASAVAAETASALVQPLARRNPIWLALGALALGGLLVWARPWRRVVKRALFAGLWSQLLSKGIAHLPLEAWLAALISPPARPSSETTSLDDSKPNERSSNART